jgi:glc operon protein GlcG
MNTKFELTLDIAKKLSHIAEQEALRSNIIISIAIIDTGGTLLHFIKMDGSSHASADICIAKARHAAYYGKDSKHYEDRLMDGGLQVLTLPHTTPIEGGVILVYKGQTVGAIGVSGAPSEEDGRIARIAASYLNTID